MNVVSFSLYGNHPIYCRGAVANAKLLPDIYPGWKMRVYCGHEVDADLRHELRALGCQVRLMPHVFGGKAAINTDDLSTDPTVPRRMLSPFGLFWRFLAASDPSAEYVIVRDCDSRLNVREKAAVEEYLASGKTAHVMHDHPAHSAPIMGGMWGIKGGILPVESLLKEWDFSSRHGDDQRFLAAKVWPLIKHDTLAHGNRGVPFPVHPPYNGFVGQVTARV